MSDQQTATAADKRPLWALVVANFISQGGNAISYLAIPWYVNEVTDDAFLVGLTSAVGVAAFVLGSFLGGALADRYDRRVVAVVADGASGVAVLLIPALHALDALSVPVLLVLVFLGAALDAPGYAAKMALIPELSRRSGYSLERATGLVSGADSAAEVGGPLLAGLLLTIASTPMALVVDGLSFYVSMVLLYIYLPKRMGRQGNLEEDFAHVSARDGVRFLSRPGPPRTITLANLATNFIGAPLFTVIMVVYLADHTAGGLSLGVLVAIGGIGLTVGAFAFARIGEKVSRRVFFVGGFAAFGAQYWFLSFEPGVLVILVVFLARGLLTGFYNPVADTVMLERVPDSILGTVLGTGQAMGMVGQPIGLLVGGFVVANFGVKAAIMSAGAAYAVVTILLALSPSTRQMERSAAPAAPDDDEGDAHQPEPPSNAPPDVALGLGHGGVPDLGETMTDPGADPPADRLPGSARPGPAGDR